MADPELAGVHTVLLDECHERHLDADLLLALLLDARAGLRPDLRLLATSATVATDRLAELLGGAPVVRRRRRGCSRWTIHAPPARGAPPHGMRVDPALLATWRGGRARSRNGDGDVLASCPAWVRSAGWQGCWRMWAGDVDVLQLHGRCPRRCRMRR